LNMILRGMHISPVISEVLKTLMRSIGLPAAKLSKSPIACRRNSARLYLQPRLSFMKFWLLKGLSKVN